MSESKGYYTISKKILINLVTGGSGLVYIIIQSSLMKFYTDVIGLSPTLYGVAFLIFSIWNGINDPIIGYWADKQPFKQGRGKYLPLIRWSIPVIAVSVLGVFLAAPGWHQYLITAYLLVLLVAYEGAHTLLGVSFMAFTVNTFISTEERTKVQAIGSYVSQIPMFLGGMIPVWFLTGDFSRPALIGIFSGAILLGLVLVWIGSLFVRENGHFYEKAESTHNLRKILSFSKGLFRDKTFVIFLLAYFFIQAATGNYFTGYLYYMDNVLEVSGLKATIPDILTGVAQMSTFPLIVLAAKKYGSRNLLWRGLLIAVVGHAVLSLPLNYWFIAATYIVILIGYGFAQVLNAPLQGLMVDHIELTTGKRQPGLVRGVMAILLVPATAMPALILSALLDVSGYVGGSKQQAPEVLSAIRLGTGIIPSVILLVGVVLLSKLPFTHAREKEIQAAIEAKHGTVADGR